MFVEAMLLSEKRTVESDLERAEYLKEYGFRTLRFANEEVHTELDGVFQMI